MTTKSVKSDIPTQSVDSTFDLNHVWHPYTSLKDPLPCYPVKRAEGVYIELEDGTKLIDGMSSWWSVIHGYNHPILNKAVTEQLADMSHVMFGGLTHKPAIDLCKKLVHLTPAGLDKVFLADSGSVAVEVALKMAIQAQLGRGFKNRNRFITIKNGYHGDTFGAMSVCDPDNSMHSLYTGILPQHYFVSAPTIKPHQVFDNADMAELVDTLEKHHLEIAAFILEPIVQGAGGMKFYHPEYLSLIRQICNKYGILLIADEIATGFGRTGKMFACEHANISPDIMCVGKAITGGYMSLAATICTTEVANDIGKCEAGVIMHGPTFMANPLACAVANASLALLSQYDWQSNVKNIETLLRSNLSSLADLDHVEDVRVFGAIGVIEMCQNVDVATIQKQFIEHNLWIRPFGRLIYVMPQYVITDEQLTALTDGLNSVIRGLEVKG
ncbi:adenosylmethionine--8-amino-7-oxononanoate transaminase [Psychrosphaera sp. B3R10]|uniref:adenosylmethionine--8-amino-7-oxononanoate transaminase n=1 Tax=unclassified Psychrosphaera TaxID=2641570 RepID=UPI001C091D84|nr:MULTISPECIES: adenosylmethionine--8-amino-7-oxononanoate transaminase [unclassified Psychrosphaera]MBU2882208.1 adenosylmethionine--8-amino-7-oxononanoate transaminase [Psychrosphaera sp. I2R16]MBU2988889.1 adenosylmethionine--8-amino-7-oxononanoate transaminase [Psychrosphaera sp. B3R10]